VTVRFGNGRVEKGDILVAADGFRSAVRNLLAPQVQPIYAGYVIWRSVVEEADLDPATHAAVFEKFNFFLEQRLNVRLLNRTTRRVSLTDKGRVFYNRCLQILGDIERAEDLTASYQSPPLRIYADSHLSFFCSDPRRLPF
jgi:2-polyprenyl-6-methoxyphenol hydroxylase-like FAD-dependent oxidoreductase